MYRHLLVPLDGTDLSTEIVGQAVEFAQTQGARITFFHAQPDYAASSFGMAELIRTSAPEEFAYAYHGRARELLAKAESAARARNVPCGSYSTVNDSPYQAIIAAARQARAGGERSGRREIFGRAPVSMGSTPAARGAARQRQSGAN